MMLVVLYFLITITAPRPVNQPATLTCIDRRAVATVVPSQTTYLPTRSLGPTQRLLLLERSRDLASAKTVGMDVFVLVDSYKSLSVGGKLDLRAFMTVWDRQYRVCVPPSIVVADSPVARDQQVNTRGIRSANAGDSLPMLEALNRVTAASVPKLDFPVAGDASGVDKSASLRQRPAMGEKGFRVARLTHTQEQ